MCKSQEISDNANIKLIGVGGAGGNAINSMIESNLRGVEFIAIDTDSKSMEKSHASEKIQIGMELTRGLGAGSDPWMGNRAANDDRDKLREVVAGADMVFVVAGLGGGTGTGVSPVIAELAMQNDALTIGVATEPFEFEGGVRCSQAEMGINELRKATDAFITIPNSKLLDMVSEKASMMDAFKMSNDLLSQAVQGITSLIAGSAVIGVDFANVKTVMSDTGRANMGVGTGTGEKRLAIATRDAISCPLLGKEAICKSSGIIINFLSDANISMAEVDETLELIRNAANSDASIIYGVTIDESFENKARATIIATGLDILYRDEWPHIKPVDAYPIFPYSCTLRSSAKRKPPLRRPGSTERSLYDDLDIPLFLRVPPEDKQKEEDDSKQRNKTKLKQESRPKHKVKASVEKIRNLIESCRKTFHQPADKHLSDSEFVGYTMNTLSAEKVERIDKHLSVCQSCAREMERLITAHNSKRPK